MRARSSPSDIAFAPITRRTALLTMSASFALAGVPGILTAQETQERRFAPRPGTWRAVEVVTSVELRDAAGDATVWVPVPTVNTEWQRSLGSTWTGNAQDMRLASAGPDAQCVVARFRAGTTAPGVQVTSRVQTMNRAADWSKRLSTAQSDESLRNWMRPTSLAPTDGIVRKTADQITEGARTDADKARRIYDWIIVNTYREPKVRGCGLGDIKVMLETGNLGGKCADLNGLFVGLCRAAGLPARDDYGLRVGPSAFGYRELGGNPEKLEGAQHCRAEVHLRDQGWVAMDPADVAKVMRQETGEWIKDADHPIVAPVRKALFGGWEGNWIAYNMASDVALPGSSATPIPFFMYPQAESGAQRHDSLHADTFTYRISAREIVV